MRNNYVVWGLRGEAIEDPAVIEEMVRRLSGQGFRGVMVRQRDSAYQLDTPKMVAAAKSILGRCNDAGMEFWWSLDPRDAVGSLLDAHPGSRQRVVMPAEAQSQGDMWRAVLEYPDFARDDSQSCTYQFERIERVFACRMGRRRPIDDEPFRAHFGTPGFLGFDDSVAEVEVVEAVQDITDKAIVSVDVARRLVEVSGQWTPSETGRWKVLTFITLAMDTFDYCSETTAAFWRSLVDLYSDALGPTLAGVLSAEPGHPFRYHHLTQRNGFFVGPEFYERFRKEKGYDLRERLYALVYEVADGSTGRVRCDYYSQWGLAMHRIQKMFKEYAVERFGPHLGVGIHCTASEWAASDLQKGTMDYFKMAETTTEGFTDGKHHDRFNAFFHIILARSLAKLTERQRAHVQTWDMYSMPSSDSYWTNVVSVSGAVWRPLPYGTSTYALGQLRGELSQLREENHVAINHKMSLIDELTKSAPAEANVLLVFPLETFMRIGDDTANSLRHATHMACYQLQAAHYQVDVVGAETIEHARVEGAKLVIRERAYDAVVYPFPGCTREGTWTRLEEFYRSGGKVLFFGCPPSETTDGESLVQRFGDMVGIAPLTGLQSYIDLDPTTPYRSTISFRGSLLGTATVNIREGFFSRIPWRQYIWPVVPTTGEAVAMQIRWVPKETVVGVANRNDLGGRAMYMGFDCSCLLDGEKFFGAALNTLGVPKLVNGPAGLWLGLVRQGQRRVVLACKRDEEGSFQGDLRVEGAVINIARAEGVFALGLGPDGKTTGLVGFGLTGVHVNGDTVVDFVEPTDVVITDGSERKISLSEASRVGTAPTDLA